jgi:hypothetical protein
MTYTRQRLLAALLPISGLILCFGMAARAETPRSLAIDQPAQVDGVRVACTGIGDYEEQEARWNNYPVKLETVGGYGQWLGDQDVTIHGNGQNVSVHCDAPWVVVALRPGRYDATLSIPNAEPKHVAFSVPRSGQRDVIVRFQNRMSGKEHASSS